MRLAILVVFSFLLSAPAGAQSLYVPAHDHLADRVRFMFESGRPKALALAVRELSRGDTNVIALSRSNDRHLPPTVFGGTSAYFAGSREHEIGLISGNWRVSYASTEGALFQGNHDAGQVYLNSLGDHFDPTDLRNPEVTMNRTCDALWRLEYASPLTALGSETKIRIALNYHRITRIQLGTLVGASAGSSLQGKLLLLSTLGNAPDTQRTDGVSLDADLAGRIHGRLYGVGWIDGLANSVQDKTVQRIDADVNVNKIEPDENGILHDVPLLSGTVGEQRLKPTIRRSWGAALAYREGQRDWILAGTYEFSWRSAVGVQLDRDKAVKVLALAQVDPFETQIGIEWKGLRMLLGASDIDPAAFKRATILFEYRLALR